MIDPLRPYWPTNRSIAGLLTRGACLLAASGVVYWGTSRSLAALTVIVASVAQGAVLVFEWMELKRTNRSGLVVGGVVGFIVLSLILVLAVESRSVLIHSFR